MYPTLSITLATLVACGSTTPSVVTGHRTTTARYTTSSVVEGLESFYIESDAVGLEGTFRHTVVGVGVSGGRFWLDRRGRLRLDYIVNRYFQGDPVPRTELQKTSVWSDRRVYEIDWLAKKVWRSPIDATKCPWLFALVNIKRVHLQRSRVTTTDGDEIFLDWSLGREDDHMTIKARLPDYSVEHINHTTRERSEEFEIIRSVRSKFLDDSVFDIDLIALRRLKRLMNEDTTPARPLGPWIRCR